MPRPRPLTNVSTAVPHGHPFGTDQQLTPRTPHSGSRTSRLEQGFSKIPLAEDADDVDYDEHEALQSAPLLASSSTARFSLRSVHSERRDPPSAKSDGRRTFTHPTQFLSKAVAQLPLAFGIFMAGVLLILIALSLTRPEALHRYIGAKAPPIITSTPSTSTSTTAVAPPPASHAQTAQNNIHVLSYENYTKFPLSGMEYRAECAKLHTGYMAHGDYWDPNSMGSFDVPHLVDKSICPSTITYMLDGTVGLTSDLAIMAQAAALARERNRTFFVDDTHWNRGKWLDHFDDVTRLQPGPQLGCKAPPPEELVACPRTARHWVISARTAKYHFAHGFSNHYENPYGHNLNRLKPIFNQALESFQSTIRPNTNIKGLITLARTELSNFIGVINERDDDVESLYVGAHVRRGDSKSLSYTYKDRKIPLSEYLTAISATWTRLHPEIASGVTPVVYLASDSPAARQKFGELYEGEIFSLFDAADPALRALASPGEYNQTLFDDLTVQSRTTATKGMLVDLALVSGLWAGKNDIIPDSTVCALSSTVCRLSPIGLGWERAFGKVNDMGEPDMQGKRWVDVDEKGSVVPVWQAFHLFN